ncbi:MAG: DsbA family oxidoreductase [Nitrospiraceae bacterium]|nr:DsbA family oxidoreductase [Nitrospiraceae bacterium]
MRIEIYSDVICPWCYVGKRRLERALGQSDGVQAQISWRPFQLNPTMPEEGMDRTLYLKAKFGSLDAFGQMKEHLLAAGVEEQIPFAFEKVLRTPNTFLAHRLIRYVEQQGRQDAVVESLFRGYFTEGADIGSVPVLGQLAGRAGLDVAAVESFLRSEEGTTEVKAEETAGRKLGIHGVPYFVFNGSLSLSGAQSPDIFLSAFQQAEKRS